VIAEDKFRFKLVMASIRNRPGCVDAEWSCIFSEVDVELFPLHAINVTIKYSGELLNCFVFVERWTESCNVYGIDSRA